MVFAIDSFYLTKSLHDIHLFPKQMCVQNCFFCTHVHVLTLSDTFPSVFLSPSMGTLAYSVNPA